MLVIEETKELQEPKVELIVAEDEKVSTEEETKIPQEVEIIEEIKWEPVKVLKPPPVKEVPLIAAKFSLKLKTPGMGAQ